MGARVVPDRLKVVPDTLSPLRQQKASKPSLIHS
jgi:hypothetical protein